MGGGNYSYDVAQAARSSRQGGSDPFDYSKLSSHPAQPNQPRQVHPLLNPYGQVRECMNAQAVVVAMDVTRSRGDDAKVVYRELPTLIGWLELRGYLPGAAIAFAAIGDAFVDQAPVQISQWERDNRLDEALSKCWLEQGGGGTGEESYELVAYYYARHSRLQINQQGQKGYFFFIGDEQFYPQVNPQQVAKILGYPLPAAIPSAQIFQELQEKFQVFFIFPQKSWQQRRVDIDAEIAQRVRSAQGQYDQVAVRVSLLWNTRDDLDIHVIAPSGEEISYSNKSSRCGGVLDVDRNVRGEDPKPVENIRWPQGKAPTGHYKVFVQNFRFHEPKPQPIEFKVELDVDGTISHYTGVMSPKLETGAASNYTVAEFDYHPAQSATPAADNYRNYTDQAIIDQWQSVLPAAHILRLDNPEDIIEVMVGAIGIMEQKVDLGQYVQALAANDRKTGGDLAQKSDHYQTVMATLGALSFATLPNAGLSLSDLPR